MKSFALIVFSFLLIACQWVKPEAGANNVALLDENKVQNCKKLGATTSHVKAKVGFVERGESKVAYELSTLARNSAQDMGGDTIVATSDIVEGKQSFDIYQCTSSE